MIRTFRAVRSRAARLALVALAATAALPTVSARGATVASDFVLPIWQGTSTSAPAVGHQIVCTTSGCAFSIYTVTSGSNCAVESITNPASGIGGANTYQSTQCNLRINGSAAFSDAGEFCNFLPENVVVSSWASGVNSTVFTTSGHPLVATMAPLTTARGTVVPRQYVLTVKHFGSGLALNGHVITMNERFLVKFNRTTFECPDADAYLSATGNIYDAATDQSLNGRDGYFTDTVAAL